MASEKSGSSKKQSTPHASTSGSSGSSKNKASTPIAHASTSGSSSSGGGSSKKPSTPTAHASTSGSGSSSKKQPTPIAHASTSGASSSNNDKTTGGQSTKLRTDVVLPQTKIRVIMKSSPEIDSIGADSVFLITKATELFIDHLTTTAYGTCKGNKNLQYKNLADVVHKHQNLEFLRDIIPIKMSARAALAEVAKQKQVDDKELFE